MGDKAGKAPRGQTLFMNVTVISLLEQLIFCWGEGDKRLITFILNFHPLTQQNFLKTHMAGTMLSDGDTMESNNSLPSQSIVSSEGKTLEINQVHSLKLNFLKIHFLIPGIAF